MPIAVRQAEVVWNGTLAGGLGALSSGSGATPKLDKAGLERNVAQAAGLCPVSNALRGNVEITVHDEVDEG